MTIINKIASLCFIFLFITNCGYSPIYTNINSKNLNLKIINSSGDDEINNIIKIKFSEIGDSNSEDSFKVEVNSIYKKETLTRNAAGDTTDYRLNLEIIFITKVKGISQKFIFQEKSDMKKKDNTFEEEKYENILKREMINLVTQKFTSQLLLIK